MNAMNIDGVSVKAATTQYPVKTREESAVKFEPKHYPMDQKQVQRDELNDKMDGINKFLKSSNTNLKFNLHEDLNEYYVTIIDVETDEVIKEIPPKKLLDIYAAMKEALGLFIDKKI